MYGHTDEQQTVHLPEGMLSLGFVSSLLFWGMAYYSWKTDAGLFETAGMFCIGSLCSCFIMAYFNCRIKYDYEGFTHKNFFGISRYYTYDQITGIYGYRKDVKITAGNKTVHIDSSATGKYEFIAYAQYRYESIYGCPIPPAENKLDFFNGNLESPGEFIAAISLMSAVAIGGMVILFCFTLPKDSEDLTYENLNFVRFEIVKDDMRLFTDDDEIYYRLSSYEEVLENPDNFIAECTLREYTVGYISFLKSDEPFYDIWTVEDSSGVCHLTLERSNELIQENKVLIFYLFGPLSAVLLLMDVASVYVARNPNKFSRKFMDRFTKNIYAFEFREGVFFKDEQQNDF